jgi:nicotinamidase-related amidase
VSFQLSALLDPKHTALLTMELQNGVVVEGGTLPALADEVRRTGILPVAGRLCAAAREAGVRVVHCTAVTRHDGAGGVENCKIFTIGGKQRRERGHNPTEIGSRGAQLVDELGHDPRDIEVPRIHGMSPFTSTALDQILRNLGVTTVVVTGVSVNLGIFGTSMTALDLGYQVVVVRDAVAGLPAEYAQAVLENSLSMIATIATSAEVMAAWSGAE